MPFGFFLLLTFAIIAIGVFSFVCTSIQVGLQWWYRIEEAIQIEIKTNKQTNKRSISMCDADVKSDSSGSVRDFHIHSEWHTMQKLKLFHCIGEIKYLCNGNGISLFYIIIIFSRHTHKKKNAMRYVQYDFLSNEQRKIPYVPMVSVACELKLKRESQPLSGKW